MKLILTFALTIFAINSMSQNDIDYSKIDTTKLPPKFREMIRYPLKWEGKQVPTFTVKDLKGNEINIDSTTKFAVIDFWFINCPPCLMELPELNAIKNKYPNVSYLGITHNTSDELYKFFETRAFDFDIIPNDTTIKSTFKVNTFPTLLVVVDGKIVKCIVGGRMGLMEILSPYLKDSNSNG